MKKLFAILAIGASLTACQSVPNLNPIKQISKLSHKQAMYQQISSQYDFNTTVQKIISGVQSKGMTVFGAVDHTAAAKQVGLTMQPATVIVFGNPKAGTPLMVKDPKFALQLPLKVLVTEQDGKVSVVMLDSKALIAGSDIEFAEIENSLAKAQGVIASLVQ